MQNTRRTLWSKLGSRVSFLSQGASPPGGPGRSVFPFDGTRPRIVCRPLHPPCRSVRNFSGFALDDKTQEKDTSASISENSTVVDGWDSLVYESMMGNADGLRDLIKAGINVSKREKTEGWTPLMHAAMGGHASCVAVLLEAGAVVNCKDSDGWTALMHAAMNGHVDCLDCLLSFGAEVNGYSDLGGTALMNAAAEGHIECLRILVAAGADIELQDSEGYDALDYAVDEGHPAAISYLSSPAKGFKNQRNETEQSQGSSQSRSPRRK